MIKFSHLSQLDAMDCGATCLAMVAKHYGKRCSIQKLREMCSASREGVSMLGISDAAEKIGFRTIGIHLSFEKLVQDAPLPCIVHWKQNHFVVVYDIKITCQKNKKEINSTGKHHLPIGTVCVADPGHGLIKFIIPYFHINK